MYLLRSLAEISDRATLVQGSLDYTMAIEDERKKGNYDKALLLENQRESLVARHREVEYLTNGKDFGQRVTGWIDTGVLPG